MKKAIASILLSSMLLRPLAAIADQSAGEVTAPLVATSDLGGKDISSLAKTINDANDYFVDSCLSISEQGTWEVAADKPVIVPPSLEVSGSSNGTIVICAELARRFQDLMNRMKVLAASAPAGSCQTTQNQVHQLQSFVHRLDPKSFSCPNGEDAKPWKERLPQFCKGLACGALAASPITWLPGLSAEKLTGGSCQTNPNSPNCLVDAITMFVKQLFSDGKAIWDGAVAGLSWVKDHGTEALSAAGSKIKEGAVSGAKWVGGQVSVRWKGLWGYEDATSEKALAASNEQFFNAGEKVWESVMNVVMGVVEDVKGAIENNFLCERWEGVPHFSECKQPFQGWDCITGEQFTQMLCGLSGYLGAQFLEGMLLGAAAGKAAGLASKAFSKVSINVAERVPALASAAAMSSKAASAVFKAGSGAAEALRRLPGAVAVEKFMGSRAVFYAKSAAKLPFVAAGSIVKPIVTVASFAVTKPVDVYFLPFTAGIKKGYGIVSARFAQATERARELYQPSNLTLNEVDRIARAKVYAPIFENARFAGRRIEIANAVRTLTRSGVSPSRIPGIVSNYGDFFLRAQGEGMSQLAKILAESQKSGMTAYQIRSALKRYEEAIRASRGS